MPYIAIPRQTVGWRDGEGFRVLTHPTSGPTLGMNVSLIGYCVCPDNHSFHRLALNRVGWRSWVELYEYHGPWLDAPNLAFSAESILAE